MNYFIGWKFGVPVKIKGVAFVAGEGLLIEEGVDYFKAITHTGMGRYLKKDYSYELIPYRGGGEKPRYPVVQSETRTSYCNYGGDMNYVSSVPNINVVRLSEEIATLTINGKTIELSRETIDRLKKELGV